MLPAVGVAVGAVALLLAAYSAISLSKVKTQVNAHEEKISHLDDIASWYPCDDVVNQLGCVRRTGPVVVAGHCAEAACADRKLFVGRRGAHALESAVSASLVGKHGHTARAPGIRGSEARIP